MLLRQMKYFVAVVECNGFTAAAERCYISQSAISQQISSLEEELGVSLLVREGRKISVTPAGEYFYNRSKAIISSVEETRVETIRIGSDSELRLSIGYLSGYDGSELQNAIVEFSRVYPEVIVSVFRGTHEDLYEALLSGKADLALSDQRRAFSPEAENLILSRAPSYVDIAAASPIAARGDVVTSDEISDIPCIIVSSKSDERVERDYYEKYLHIGRQFLFAASLDEARLMAMGGRGYIAVESVSNSAQPPLKRLEVRRPDGSAIERIYCAFWYKKRTNYYIEEFADILRRQYPVNS